ncbi:MAG: ABC-ATPase domain-containing protein [Thermoleophilia bacterium]
MDAASLQRKLEQLDGRGYKAYRQIRGAFEFPRFTLFVDYVQGDPFAAPSRLRVRVKQDKAGFDPDLFTLPVRRIALRDYLARVFQQSIGLHVNGHRGTGKSGFMGVDAGNQEILERTSVVVTGDYVEVRFTAGLPASGRRCLGHEAVAMLIGEVPRLVDGSMFYGSLDANLVRRHVEAAEDQEWLRGRLGEMGLIAFVGDGSILPRESGIKDLPLKTADVIAFQSPDELKVEVRLPNRGKVSGMGIPEGVTLIAGGGYHGKSTLLSALQRCVYSHVPGDGRELVVTRADAVKIRAEDGRRVEKVDISPFISNLPFGTDTVAFCTENASGSTSQAANIIEALETDSRMLLIDEDTSATNFMIRDELMQRLISRDKEPITPFVDQVQNLHKEYGVSTILVMGGSGDYFEVADTVIAMENYRPFVVTERAREIATTRRDVRVRESGERFGDLVRRAPMARGIDPRRGSRDKVQAKSLGSIAFGRQMIDLAAVEQIVDISQTRAIGDMVWYGLRQGYFNGESPMAGVLDQLFDDLSRLGLDVISPFAAPDKKGAHPGDYAMPRRHEVAAMLNRLRSLEVIQEPGGPVIKA